MRRHKWLSGMIVAVLIAAFGYLASGFTITHDNTHSTSQPNQSAAAEKEWQIHSSPHHAAPLQAITGPDQQSCSLYGVCATDLGIPFSLPSGEIGYLYGDTFATATPEAPGSAASWRSPVMLRSSSDIGSPVVFSGASGINQPGMAPEVMYNNHIANGEFTTIPNDGITLPDGTVVLSYMSVRDWTATPTSGWQTNYAGLALSTDGGNSFNRDAGPKWWNNPDNTDPFQMQSMQLGSDGYVYLYSVPAGRQHGAMMLQRVPWQQMMDKAAYQCWNGRGFGGDCWPLFIDDTGEPSVRMLHQDGHEVWVMSYLNAAKGFIGTRVAKQPQGPWSDVKVQLTGEELPYLYGGFIDPRSTPEHLILAVSSWQRDDFGNTTRYNVTLYKGDT